MHVSGFICPRATAQTIAANDNFTLKPRCDRCDYHHRRDTSMQVHNKSAAPRVPPALAPEPVHPPPFSTPPAPARPPPPSQPPPPSLQPPPPPPSELSCGGTCYLEEGSLPCSSFVDASCEQVARIASRECRWKNGTMNPMACADCCHGHPAAPPLPPDLPPSPPGLPAPPQPPTPPDTKPISPGVAAGLGAVGGVLGLMALVAAAVLLNRWRRRMVEARGRNRHVQLNEAHAFNVFYVRQRLGPEGPRAANHRRRSRAR